MTYELHPLCTLFPRLSGAEFDALRDDIAANGLRQPIVLHGGMILDGGNRYRACVDAGVTPKFVEFDGGNLVSFVLSSNLHRRHMSAGQQAAIVASAQDWAKAQTVGNPAFRQQEAQSGNVAGLATVADRAAQSGASERTQRMADKVAKADPELAKQVAHGEVSLPKAVEQVEAKQPKQEKPAAKPADGGDELARLRAENEALREQIEDLTAQRDELASNLSETLAENESLVRVFESDDKLAAALDEAKRYREQARVVESRIAGLMNSENQAKRIAKTFQNKCAKLERQIKDASNDGIDPAVGF